MQQVTLSISGCFVGVCAVCEVGVAEISDFEAGAVAVGAVREANHGEVDTPSITRSLDVSTSHGGSLLCGSCSWTVVCVVRGAGKVGDPKILAIISFLEFLLGVLWSVGLSSSTDAGHIICISD